MNSLLPNMRLLCLPSEHEGKDWWELSQKIDALIEGEGMDLAQEEVYLLFSENDECVIARAIVGPKKTMAKPFLLIDWVAAPVWRERVFGTTLQELAESSEKVRERAKRELPKLAQPFMLCVRRELKPDLKLTVEAIFHE